MWLRQARRGLHGCLSLFSLQHTCITQCALCVSRRRLSLTDLAKAFDDLGTGSAEQVSSSSSLSSNYTSNNSSPHVLPREQTSLHRPRWRSEMSSLTRVRSGAAHKQSQRGPHKSRVSNDDTAIMMAFSMSYAEQLRSMSEPALCSELDLQRRRLAHANMVLCLLEVYRRLWLSQGGQEEMTSSSMPLRDTRLRVLYVPDAEAEGSTNSDTSASTQHNYGRSDRLLEAVLRVLAKISPVELEVYAERWLHSATTTTVQESAIPNKTLSVDKTRMTAVYPFLQYTADVVQRPFAYLFGTFVQQWLLSRVASLPLERCVEFIHLIVQQRFFYSDPLLLTLVDTVLVRRHELNDMNALALLFDSMLRCQNDVSAALRLQHSTINSNSSVSFDSVASLPRAWHPLLNEGVHHALAERFVLLLHNAQQQQQLEDGGDNIVSKESTSVSVNSNNSLSTLTTTSFLFLTLALARLWYFDKSLITALLPGLPNYLRHHPEQYYGPIMMLGREENTCCEPAVLEVLVHNLTQLLTRRGQAYQRELHAQRTLRRQLGSLDTANVTDDVALSAVLPDNTRGDNIDEQSHLISSSSSVMRDGVAVGQEGMLGDEDEGMDELLADTTTTTTTTITTSKTDATVTTAVVPPTFKVSLIDIHAFGSFLTCLWHQYTLVFDVLQTKPTTSESRDSTLTVQPMQRAMYTLVCRLLDDVYSGVASLEALRLGMSGPAIERLLRLMLRIGQQLAQEQGELHSASQTQENTNETHQECGLYVLHHPLLVELTYVWTLHIRRRVVSHRTQQTSLVSSSLCTRSQHVSADTPLVRVNDVLSVTASTLQPAWQKYAKDLLQSLLHVGLLVREVNVRPNSSQSSRANIAKQQPVRIHYMMPDRLIDRTPRVRDAVMAVKQELARIMQRQHQRRRQQQQQQQQQQGDEAVVTDVHIAQAVRTPAVFGRFSAVMKLISSEPV